MSPTPPREESLFQRAAALPAADRAAFLDRECADDAPLRARLDALLAAHEQLDAALDGGGEADRSTITLELSDLPDPAVGMTIGRYKLLEKLGEGGCGVVYVAEQTEPVRRRVALKLIKLGMDTREVIARFEAERQALAMMDHPNIAKVLDAGTTETDSGSRGDESAQISPEESQRRLTSAVTIGGGRPYFVMELVRGIHITDYCDQSHLSTKERLHLFIKVCQAIQHAHQKGIIHRDIKPSNILVTLHDGDPVPKVIDFGIAKATQGMLTDATVYTQLHQFIGTPAYMSPEQAEMSGLDIDTRSDIYGLGVLLYELLTGATPFDAKELLASGIDAMRKTIREQEPLRPSTRLTRELVAADVTPHQSIPGGGTAKRAEVSADSRRRLQERVCQVRGDLDWIVMKCLEKDRGRRYETANGLAADLNRHLENEPVVARPPSALYRLQKAWRRHRLVFAAGTAVGVMLLVSVVILTKALQEQNLARERAEDAEQEERRERSIADEARRVASVERDRAARLLSVSQAEHGVQLLEKSDPIGLLHLLEARRSVEHLAEDRLRRTLLWSGWMESLPKPENSVPQAAVPIERVAHEVEQPWMATRTTNGEVVLHDKRSGELLATVSTGKEVVASPELSSNGRLLIVHTRGTYQLWDLAPVRSNEPPRRLLARILRYAFDPNHLRVLTFANQEMPLPGEPFVPQADLSSSAGHQLQIWDSGAEVPLIATWEGDRQELMNQEFALSADGSKVAAGWHSITLWDAKSGQPVQPQLSTNGVPGERGFFDSLHFSPDSRSMWVVRGDICLRYDLSTGKPVGDPITGLHRRDRPSLSPDGRQLMLSLENGFQVVQLDSGEYMGPLIPRDEDLATRALALGFDGRRLATTGPDRGLRIWDTVTGKPMGPPVVLASPPTGASFSPDGQYVTLSAHSGRSRVYRIEVQAPSNFRFWPGLRLLGLNSQGEVLVHDSQDQRIRWIDPETGLPVSTGWRLPDQGRLIGFALSADGRMLATATEIELSQSTIRFWDSTTGAPRGPSITWTNVGTLAFSPDGRLLAGLGGGDGSIHAWDVTSGELRSIMSWSHPPQVVWIELGFSPDARFLAARNSYAFSVWNLAERQFATGSERDFYMAISQDWRLAVTDSELFDFSDPRQPLPAPNPVTSRSTPANRGGMAISPDGRLRVSERLWEIATGRPVGRELKMSGLPLRMEFSPDNRLLIASGIHFDAAGQSDSGARLRLWETSTGLPCGPTMRGEVNPMGFHFDPEVRWLGFSILFDGGGAQALKLPTRKVPLQEMERQTWLLTGCRLDEAGDLEILSTEEIRRLEAVSGTRL